MLGICCMDVSADDLISAKKVAHSALSSDLQWWLATPLSDRQTADARRVG